MGGTKGIIHILGEGESNLKPNEPWASFLITRPTVDFIGKKNVFFYGKPFLKFSTDNLFTNPYWIFAINFMRLKLK